MSRFRIRTRLAFALACAFALAIVASAHPATPSSGTVSKAKPRVDWAGSLTSSGIFYEFWMQDATQSCFAPLCDTYTLTLADGPIDLTIGLNLQSQNTAGGDPGCGLRVAKPDSTIVYKTGSCGPKTTLKLVIKGAANGAYVIDSVSSHVCCGTEDYKAFAELPGATPPAEGGTPPPPPASTDFKLTVSAPKVSAKKAKKGAKIPVSVTTSRPVQQVAATLRSGKKVVGKGKVSNFSGKGKVSVKLSRKLKKGSYKLVVQATDGSTRVSKTVTVKVR